MNTPERKFIKPGTISDYLKCPICMEVFLNATRLYCGHTFCEGCIKDSMNLGNTCPQCRTKIVKKDIGIDLLARQIINELEVFCPSQDCPWKGRAQQLEKHYLKQCRFCEKQRKQKLNKNQGKSIKNNYIPLQSIKDDEILEKINQNTMKGSLVARVFAKNQSFKDEKLKILPEPQQKQQEQQKTDKKIPSKQKLVHNKKRSKEGRVYAKPQTGLQNKQQNKRTSNFDFLESLFD